MVTGVFSDSDETGSSPVRNRRFYDAYELLFLSHGYIYLS
jgi:hypothetical protein